MTINIEDFFKWLSEDKNMGLKYTEKAVIKCVVSDYAEKITQEPVPSVKYEAWLDKDFTWGSSDRSKGLTTATYNALRRAYKKKDGVPVNVFSTNRELDEASDEFLASFRNMSKKKVEEIREYIRLNKERILGGKYD